MQKDLNNFHTKPYCLFQFLKTGIPIGGDEPVPAARQEPLV